MKRFGRLLDGTLVLVATILWFKFLFVTPDSQQMFFWFVAGNVFRLRMKVEDLEDAA